MFPFIIQSLVAAALRMNAGAFIRRMMMMVVMLEWGRILLNLYL